MRLPSITGREEGGRGGSPLVGFFVLAITISLAILFWDGFPGGSRKTGDSALAEAASLLPTEYFPVHLELLSRDGGVLRAKMKLCDLGGRELSISERTMKGESLIIDCWVLCPPGSGKASTTANQLAFVFPRRVRGDREVFREGRSLYDAYSEQGFPGILGGSPPGGSPFDAPARKVLVSLLGALAKADTSADATLAPGPALSAVKGLAGMEYILGGLEIGHAYAIGFGAGGEVTLRGIAAF